MGWDAVECAGDVGNVDGRFLVVVGGKYGVEDAECDEVFAGALGAECPLAVAVRVGGVEVGKEEFADGAFGNFGEDAGKVDAAVIGRGSGGTAFEKGVDPMNTPANGPAMFTDHAAEEFGEGVGNGFGNGLEETAG